VVVCGQKERISGVSHTHVSKKFLPISQGNRQKKCRKVLIVARSHYCTELRKDTFSSVLTSIREKNFLAEKAWPPPAPA
jgi:hypothetical protein